MDGGRRALLKALLATPLAMTMDLEQLLWVPDPRSRIVVPTPWRGPLTLRDWVTVFRYRWVPPHQSLAEGRFELASTLTFHSSAEYEAWRKAEAQKPFDPVTLGHHHFNRFFDPVMLGNSQHK